MVGLQQCGICSMNINYKVYQNERADLDVGVLTTPESRIAGEILANLAWECTSMFFQWIDFTIVRGAPCPGKHSV